MSIFPSLPNWNRSSWKVLSWVLLMLVLFLLSTDAGELSERGILTDWLALSSEAVYSGKIWVLLSYCLLHGNWLHLIMNTVMLYFIAHRIINILDARRAFNVFLMGSVVGGILFLLVSNAASNRALIGASGGVFALLMLLITLSPESRMWPLPVSGVNMGLGMMISSIFLMLITPGLGVPLLAEFGERLENEIPGMFRIEHACHVGGGLAGFVYGRWILRRPVSLETLQKRRMKREGQVD